MRASYTYIGICQARDDDDEAAYSASQIKHRQQLEAVAQAQGPEGDQASGEAEGDRDRGVAAELPVGEGEADPTGIVDWKTMAPVMLPSASESFPSRTQKKLLTFSGSSVARGARIRESTIASTPISSAKCSSSSTNRCAPPTIAASPISTWTIATLSGGSVAAFGPRAMISELRLSSDWISPLPRSVKAT